jgi:hypothetical protein
VPRWSLVAPVHRARLLHESRNQPDVIQKVQIWKKKVLVGFISRILIKNAKIEKKIQQVGPCFCSPHPSASFLLPEACIALHNFICDSKLYDKEFDRYMPRAQTKGDDEVGGRERGCYEHHSW